MIDDGFVVVRAHPSLLVFVDHLQKKNAECLSFYPAQVFEREAARGRILLGLLNGQPCGYLYYGAVGGDVKCHQVCIEYDARRRLYGAALVVALEDAARAARSRSITLRCGFDIDANSFWREMGYVCVAHRQGGIRRMRTINVWRKALSARLFEDVVIEPATGKTDARIWAKHRQTGIVTQFARGSALASYRATVLARAEESKP